MRMRKAFRKIHRWVGMISAVWLLQLATTGLMLQHADDFGLTSSYVTSPSILKWFNYGQRQQAWDATDDVFYQVDAAISFGGHYMKMDDALLGAVKSPDGWSVVSSQTLYRYNEQGDLAMQLDSFDGLPTPITQLALVGGKAAIQSSGQWFSVNSSGVTERLESPPIQVTSSRTLSTKEQDKLLPIMLKGLLSYDKVIHGIHAGIKSSSWLNTLSALALFYLCFSGMYLFFKQPKSKIIR